MKVLIYIVSIAVAIYIAQILAEMTGFILIAVIMDINPEKPDDFQGVYLLVVLHILYTILLITLINRRFLRHVK